MTETSEQPSSECPECGAGNPTHTGHNPKGEFHDFECRQCSNRWRVRTYNAH